MNNKVIKLRDGEVIENHIFFDLLGYTTLCGMDGSDEGVGQVDLGFTEEAVTCAHCHVIYHYCMNFNPDRIIK